MLYATRLAFYFALAFVSAVATARASNLCDSLWPTQNQIIQNQLDWELHFKQNGFSVVGQSTLYTHPGSKQPYYIRLTVRSDGLVEPQFYVNLLGQRSENLAKIESILANADFEGSEGALRPPDLTLIFSIGSERLRQVTVTCDGRTANLASLLRPESETSAAITYQQSMTAEEKLRDAGFAPIIGAPGFFLLLLKQPPMPRSLHALDVAVYQRLHLQYSEPIPLLAHVEHGQITALLRPLQIPESSPSNKAYQLESVQIETQDEGHPARESVHVVMTRWDLKTALTYNHAGLQQVHHHFAEDFDTLAIPSRIAYEQLGYEELLAPNTEPSGFRLAAVNSNATLAKLETNSTINGVHLFDAEQWARKWGLLKANGSLLAELQLANREIHELHLNHQILSKPLLFAIWIVRDRMGDIFTFNGHRYQVSSRLIGTDVGSPFDLPLGLSSREMVITELASGTRLHFAEPLAYTIARYGFYGPLQPEKLSQFFNLHDSPSETFPLPAATDDSDRRKEAPSHL